MANPRVSPINNTTILLEGAAMSKLDLSELAGMIKARAAGLERSLDEFDAAAMLSKSEP